MTCSKTILKTTTAFIVALLLLFIINSERISAQSNGFEGGEGTSGDPYLVETAEQLDMVRNYPDAHFMQNADIDLGVAPWNTGEGWEPIGSIMDIEAEAFNGTYDGNGFVIKNLFINSDRVFGSALFGWSGNDSRLINIYLENVNITGILDVAGIVGDASGEISSCYVSGNIKGEEYVGGLVGMNEALIRDCTVEADIEGIEYIGGLVGWNSSGDIEDSSFSGAVDGVGHVGGLAGWHQVGKITGCNSAGTVTGTGNYIGGLVGLCVNAEIALSTSAAAVSGNDYIGGLIGYNAGFTYMNHASGDVTGNKAVGGLVGASGSGDIIRSFALGNVTGDEQVGGLAGYADGTIQNCYARGTVTGNRYTGGLTGVLSGYIKKSYSTGAITGDLDAGGLVGINNPGALVQSSYYDRETSGKSDDDGRGMPKSTSEMKNSLPSVDIFKGWSETSWVFSDGHYPFLADIDYHFTLELGEGWNLLSLPRPGEIFYNSKDINAGLTFKDGDWSGTVTEEELSNPARALFLKAEEPTVLYFIWENPTPENEFAEQQLEEGWNLISSGLQADYLTILAGLHDEGDGGLTQIFAPNSYNGRKQEGYHLPWESPLIGLLHPGEDLLMDMYPLDGYWVYLKGDSLYYSTPVSTEEVQPVDDPPVIRVGANPGKGFHWAYYLYLPDSVYDNPNPHLMVGPNNTGYQDDDPQVHDQSAFEQASRSWKTYIATDLGVPLLVPTFPRPMDDFQGYNWRHYTHALNRATLMIDSGSLLRIDLQLIAMINDAKGRLASMGINVDDQVFLNGYSACGTFSNRFTILHPHIVKAVASGGINAIPTFPTAEWDDKILRYPVGIADINTIAGIAFDQEEYLRVPQYIYMGSEDDNDATEFDDAFERQDAELIWDLVGREMDLRWQNSEQLYADLGIINAQFVTYEGVGHRLNHEILYDIITFFEENSGH